MQDPAAPPAPFLLLPPPPAARSCGASLAPGAGPGHTADPGARTQPLSPPAPVPLPTCPPRPCRPGLERRRGAQTPLTHLVNIFLGGAFSMVVHFGAEVAEPHVGVAEKNLKPHRTPALYPSEHLPLTQGPGSR